MNNIEQAYIQGFMQKCAEAGVDPVAMLKVAQEAGGATTGTGRIPEEDASRLGSYVASILPFGTQILGAKRDESDPLIGMVRAQQGQQLGGLAGLLGGGLGGAGLGALVALLSRGKIKPSTGAIGGGIGGGLGGSLIGGAEGLHRATTV